MKIFNKPKIYLAGKQQLDYDQIENFLDDENTHWHCTTNIPGQQIPEVAGRICYMSFGNKQGRKDNGSYLNHIIQVGHGSVLEHTVYNFVITGISRSLTHELIRHRAGFGYSQLSQRYVDEGDANFIMPPAMQGNEELEAIVSQYCEQSVDVYKELTDKLAESYSTPEKMIEFALRDGILSMCGSNLYTIEGSSTQQNIEFWIEYCKVDAEINSFFKKKTRTTRRKAAREAARCVLPNATETKIFITANARALRHFFELRGDIHAEPEIRILACELCKLMRKEAPNIFGDIDVEELTDGTERTISVNKKV